MNKRILVVDDDQEFHKGISAFLNKHDFQCDVANNADEARELLLTGAYAGCFIDMVLQTTSISFYANAKLSEDGLELAKEINKKVATIFVILTGASYETRIGGFLNINKGSIDMSYVLEIATAMCNKNGEYDG